MARYKSVKKRRKDARRTQIIIAVVLALVLTLSVIIILIKKNNYSDDISSSNHLIEPVNMDNNESTTTKLSEIETEITTTVIESTATTEAETVTEELTEEIDEALDEPTYIDGVLIVNKTYKLPKDYNPGSLDDAVIKAFYQMQEDAKSEGLSLWIASGFRSYEAQERIYNNYVNREGQEIADTFSARAGFSEHQTGLAFDLNTISDSFADTTEGVWVADNAHKYGFIIRYPKGKESITGYKYEPWHLRYVGVEFATELYDSDLTLEEYFNIKSAYKSN